MIFVVGHFRLRSHFAGSVLIGSDHLKSNRSWIMGRSLSYEILKGVRPAWLGCYWSSHPLLAYLSWFEGLEFPTWSFLVGQLVTRTCCVAVRTSSSSMEYLFTRLNRSSIVSDCFLAKDSKNNIPKQMLLLKICRMTSMLQNSTWSTTYLNCFTNSLKDSFSCILMFCRALMFCLYHAEPR